MSNEEKVAPLGIDFVGYLVKDIARARRFYEEGLGFVPTSVNDDGPFPGAEYILPNGDTFGISKPKEFEWHPSGWAMIAFPDVESATARIAEHGGTVVAANVESPVCFLSICHDTEGNWLVLHQRKDGSVG